MLDRAHFDPGHVTAGAFVTCRGHLLLIRHARLGRWLQPGGHVEPADAGVAAAARRELREEAALDLTGGRLLDLDVHPIPADPRRGEPPHAHFDVRFHFAFDGDPAAARAGDDAAAVRWVPLAGAVVRAGDPSVARAARKLRDSGAAG